MLSRKLYIHFIVHGTGVILIFQGNIEASRSVSKQLVYNKTTTSFIFLFVYVLL